MNTTPRWNDLTPDEAQKLWLGLQDELNSHYGGEFVDYLLERMGSSNLLKQVAFLECMLIVRDEAYDKLEYEVSDEGGLVVWYKDEYDNDLVRL